MKLISLFILLVLFISTAGCLRDPKCELEANLNVNQERFQQDLDTIDAHLAEISIAAETDETGLRYVIDRRGSDVRANLCSDILVTYEGRLLATGEVFDSSEIAVPFALSNLIVGWQIGIPKIGPGGSITLYIPSGYAFGSRSTDTIPANSILIFDITLIAVQ